MEWLYEVCSHSESGTVVSYPFPVIVYSTFKLLDLLPIYLSMFHLYDMREYNDVVRECPTNEVGQTHLNLMAI